MRPKDNTAVRRTYYQGVDLPSATPMMSQDHDQGIALRPDGVQTSAAPVPGGARSLHQPPLEMPALREPQGNTNTTGGVGMCQASSYRSHAGCDTAVPAQLGDSRQRCNSIAGQDDTEQPAKARLGDTARGKGRQRGRGNTSTSRARGRMRGSKQKVSTGHHPLAQASEITGYNSLAATAPHSAPPTHREQERVKLVYGDYMDTGLNKAPVASGYHDTEGQEELGSDTETSEMALVTTQPASDAEAAEYRHVSEGVVSEALVTQQQDFHLRGPGQVDTSNSAQNSHRRGNSDTGAGGWPNLMLGPSAPTKGSRIPIPDQQRTPLAAHYHRDPVFATAYPTQPQAKPRTAESRDHQWYSVPPGEPRHHPVPPSARPKVRSNQDPIQLAPLNPSRAYRPGTRPILPSFIYRPAPLDAASGSPPHNTPLSRTDTLHPLEPYTLPAPFPKRTNGRAFAAGTSEARVCNGQKWDMLGNSSVAADLGAETISDMTNRLWVDSIKRYWGPSQPTK